MRLRPKWMFLAIKNLSASLRNHIWWYADYNATWNTCLFLIKTNAAIFSRAWCTKISINQRGWIEAPLQKSKYFDFSEKSNFIVVFIIHLDIHLVLRYSNFVKMAFVYAIQSSIGWNLFSRTGSSLKGSNLENRTRSRTSRIYNSINVTTNKLMRYCNGYIFFVVQ